MTTFDDSFCDEIYHIFCVASLCKLLASSEGLDPDLAEVMGLLHDSGRIFANASSKEHGASGATYARDFLLAAGGFSEKEIKTITSAIHTHSMKRKIHGPYNEILKNADLFQRLFGEGSFDPKYFLRLEMVGRRFETGTVHLMLQAHFKNLASYLNDPLDLSHSEGVHDARIHTRQLLIFLSHYGSMLQKNCRKSLTQHYKKLLKNLGILRDVDITLAYLSSLKLDDHLLAAHQTLSDQLMAHRSQCLSGIIKSSTFLQPCLVFKPHQKTTFKKLRAHDKRRFIAAYHQVTQDWQKQRQYPFSTRKLHQVRKQVRLCRYVEMISLSPLAPVLKDALPFLKNYQDALGRLQDLVAIERILKMFLSPPYAINPARQKKKEALRMLKDFFKNQDLPKL